MKGVARFGTLGLLLSSTLLSCADNESILFVRGVMALETGSCVAVADASATLLGDGTYDVAFGNAYYAALLVGNQLASQGDKSRTRTETASINLEGAEVTLRRPNGSVLREKFTSPGTGYIAVGSGEDAGYGVLGSVLIPASAGEDAVGEELSYVIAEIRVFGTTLGGQEVESGIFKFPITVCYGCLVRFPASAMSTDGTTCIGTSEAESSQPCRLGQDEAVSCAACAGKFGVCQTP